MMNLIQCRYWRSLKWFHSASAYCLVEGPTSFLGKKLTCDSPLSESSNSKRFASGNVDQLVARLRPLPQLLVRPCERPQLLPGGGESCEIVKLSLPECLEIGKGLWKVIRVREGKWVPTCQRQLEGQFVYKPLHRAKTFHTYRLW